MDDSLGGGAKKELAHASCAVPSDDDEVCALLTRDLEERDGWGARRHDGSHLHVCAVEPAQCIAEGRRLPREPCGDVVIDPRRLDSHVIRWPHVNEDHLGALRKGKILRSPQRAASSGREVCSNYDTFREASPTTQRRGLRLWL
ncbi:MAG: hypothetical protein OHK0013_32840 [Sandaracinaceae bacterium]